MNDIQTQVRFTQHAFNNSQQRFISEDDIAIILKYGSVVYRQNVKFHFIKECQLPGGLTLNKRITSIVVLTSWDGAVITCYYNNRPRKHLAKKNKRYSEVKKYKYYQSGMSMDEIVMYQHGHILLS